MVRGLGPSLAGLGVSDVLADPALELCDGNGTLLKSDADWMDDPDQKALLLASHLAPTKNKEAALEISLLPGAYPAILSGNGNTGVGIVEIYNKQ